MKTYITDDYQVTVKDNASIVIFIPCGTVQVDYIIYNPGKRKLWTHIRVQYAHKQYSKSAKSITELRLPQGLLKELHKALEVVNKQDIMDAEIVFVNDKEEDR